MGKIVDFQGKKAKELMKHCESGIHLVDFWAFWCGPCRMIAPVVEELAENNSVIKVNVDENSLLAQEMGIRSIPTVMVIKDGEIVASEAGAKSKDHYQKMLDEQK